jgi:hypothetical protein
MEYISIETTIITILLPMRCTQTEGQNRNALFRKINSISKKELAFFI